MGMMDVSDILNFSLDCMCKPNCTITAQVLEGFRIMPGEQKKMFSERIRRINVKSAEKGVGLDLNLTSA